MFSSLPSASKIYVSSCNPRQKSLNSAKKKRKKIVSSSLSVHSHDEETLVQASIAQNNSVSQISTSSHQSTDNDRCLADEEITPRLDALNSLDLFEKNENDCLNTETDSELHYREDCDTSNDIFYNQVSDAENSSQILKINQEEQKTVLVVDNEIPKEESKFECDVDDNVSSNEAMHNSSSVVNVSDQQQEHEEIIDQLLEIECDENQLAVNPIISVSDDKLNHTLKPSNLKNDVCNQTEQSGLSNPGTCKNLHVSNTGCSMLGDNLNSDLYDSTSVQSDCYMSTEIYHEHIDNSENSSADENENCQNIENGVPSPEQSESSYTESMCNVQNACQTESTYNSCVTLDTETSKMVTAQVHSNAECLTNSPVKKIQSHNNADLQKLKSEERLKHSVSLPENISDSKILDKFKNSSYSEISNDSKHKPLFDKYTSTIDLNLLQSDKSTITSDCNDCFSCKKDAATTPIKVESFKTEPKTTFQEAAAVVVKVLPPVGIMQARSRSYVFGNVGATGSLLGNEELTRFFPDNKVTIFVGTWNMNGLNPPGSIDDFLLPLDVSCVPDIYAVGVQESMQSRSEWEILLQTTIGPSHVLFASTSFGVLHISIFMRRDLIWFCSEPEEANIATRPGSMIKTKGAVAICFLFFGTSFLFVNSHLTAHEQNLKERLSDYEKICSLLDLPKQIPLKHHLKNKDVTSRFDCVFWCGDLNFRVVHDRPSVLSFVEEKIRRPLTSNNLLMEHDQLSQAMAKGIAFQGFKEGVINFIPSYKFDVGTSCFDSVKQRVPSYTDRILYRSRHESSIVCLNYNAVSEISTSDHKPVFAIFNVSVQPGRDNIPLAAGLFKRSIYLEAIKRRARQLEITRNQKQSTVCSVM